jgi:hypothetical protein
LLAILQRRGTLFFYIFVVLIFFVTACGKPIVQSDHPAGKSLVIYWGKDRDTKRAAFRIATIAGAALADLAGKWTSPNIADYDNIFIGAPLEEGAIPSEVTKYLDETDFLDRYVMIFLTSRTDPLSATAIAIADTSEPVVSQMVKKACIISERLFIGAKSIKKSELNKSIDFWTNDVLSQVIPPVPIYRRDNPAGRSLVLFWGNNRANTRIAYEIAEVAGAELFDITSGGDTPDLLNFDSFYVGIPLDDDSIPLPLKEFLARTDFIDGYTAIFWTRAEQSSALYPGDTQMSFVLQVQGARIMAEYGFSNVNNFRPAELEAAVRSMTEPLITRFTAIHGAGLRAEYVMKAFALVYSDRITEVSFKDDDWAFRMDDTWYYYAEGRILPEAEHNNIDLWRSQQIYRYAAASSFAPAKLDVSRRFQFSASYGRDYSVGTVQYPFYEDLLQTGTRAKAASQLRTIDLFGYNVAVHHALVTPLANVEKSVLVLAETDETVTSWLKSLWSITCWNWRNIAGSERRSYHAYGIAVDLQMSARDGFETYWQWTAQKGIDWRTLPRDKLLSPPTAVVHIFEANGFLWGGRWPWYDTMHFEYRPELLLLASG